MKRKFMLFLAMAASVSVGGTAMAQATIGKPMYGGRAWQTSPAHVEYATLGCPEPVEAVSQAASPCANQGAAGLQLCGAKATPKSTIDVDTPIYIENGNGELVPMDAVEEESNGDDDPWRIFPNDVAGFNMTGWIYGTGLGNPTNSSDTRYNGPMTMNDQNGAYLNQLWMNINRPLKDEMSWGAGFDIFYGNDYLASQSRGFENRRARGWLPHWNNNKDYGFAIPQCYLTAGTNKYNVRLGHFYTPHGFMVVQAPGNFFNTLPWGFMMTNPFTHWGGQFNANVTDQLSMMFGVVNGWDALDRPVNSAAYMGGIRYAFKENKGFFSYNLITGLEPENRGSGYANRTLMTTIIDYKVTDRIECVMVQNLGFQGNHGFGTDTFYNFAPFAFLKINDNWRFGLRYEYFHDPFGFIAAERVGNPNNSPIAANAQAGPYQGNMQTVGAGLNWSPNGSKNLMIRPEIRYDWFNAQGYSFSGDPFDNGRSNHQLMLMVGAFYQY